MGEAGPERPLGRLRQRLTSLAPAGLLARVRWLFLVFSVLTLSTTLVAVLHAPDTSARDRAIAALILVALLLWALYRYRRPRASAISDVVAVGGLFFLGVTLGTVFYTFGPVFVLLYLRSMYGSTRQALITGVLFFAAFHGSSVVVGEAEPVSLGVALFLVSFTAIAWVMQSLASAAERHELLVARERILTETSSELLAARTRPDVYDAAARGLLRLGGDPGGLATVWRFRDNTLELKAQAGPGKVFLDRVDASQLAPERIARLVRGHPYLLGLEAVRATEEMLGLPRHYEQILVAPMMAEGSARGALALAVTRPLQAGVLDVAARFANEVSLGLERTRLLVQLEKANAELRRADDMKNQFISTVSHELRTPLTSIRGFAETLRTRWDSLPAEARNHYLDVIDRQGARQQRLVEDLLTTSTVLSGRLRVEPTDMALAPVIDAAVEELEIDRDDLELSIPDGAAVHADPHHVQQIFANLLSNARKYGAPPYGIDAAVAGDRVTVRVWDHGGGVDERFRPYLFEPFRQADSTDRRGGAGVGLGLAIVRSLAVANDGAIRYLDDANKGATFALDLPRAKAR